jgi:glutamate 5-kinase
VIVVVKIGTSSITDRRGVLDPAAIGGLCAQVGDLHAAGHLPWASAPRTGRGTP